MNEQNETGKDIFVRNIFAKRYNIEFSDKFYTREFKFVRYESEFVSTNVIAEINSDEVPSLKCGDNFYLSDKFMVVKIVDIMKNSNGTTTYRVNDLFIDDEYSKKQKSEQENMLKNLISEEEKVRSLEEKENVFNKIKQSGKYKRFFKLFDKMLKEKNK